MTSLPGVASVRAALGLHPPGRKVRVDPSDTFLVSYPRSGNTWMRFILAALARPGEQIDLGLVQEIVPDIYQQSARAIGRTARPRLLKSHEPFDERYRRVVYLVRDPREVAVSYFYFQGGPAKSVSLETYAAEFAAGSRGPYGSWREHVEGWRTQRDGSPGFMLIRYEDLKSEPARHTERVARFVGLPSDAGSVERALEAATYERMQTRVARPALLGRGGAGAQRSELPVEARRTIERAFGAAMGDLGYV